MTFDIVLFIDRVHTLFDVVIVDLTWIDLVSRTTISKGVVRTIVTQAKDGFYHDRHPKDMFLPFVVEIFDCLHQQKKKDLIHWCANMTWLAKGIESIPLSIL